MGAVEDFLVTGTDVTTYWVLGPYCHVPTAAKAPTTDTGWEWRVVQFPAPDVLESWEPMVGRPAL